MQPEAAAFDGLAAGYDAGFTDSSLGQVLRARVWQRFEARFAGRSSLLELGCGTGEDAIHLARLGHRILATDASEQMIRVARAKADRAGVADRIRFVCAPMERVASGIGDEVFDGVFSNFGAVNCVEDISALASGLATRLVAGAPLIFVAMGRHVPWEWAWYLARGKPAQSFRRMRRNGVEWRGLRVRYPTPGSLAAALSPGFTVTQRSGLGFVLPPSYASGWLDSAPRTLAVMAALERATAGFTARLADHFVIEAVRR
jgi:SAM-dependent methyltransferase